MTTPSAFGIDPFQSEEDKIRAETEFNFLYFDLGDVLNCTVNEHYHPFQDCLTELINITRRCARVAYFVVIMNTTSISRVIIH